MYIKPHSTNNEYIRAGDIWVRNLTKKVVPLSLNNMFDKKDYQNILSNISKNTRYPNISDELLIFRKIVIVSDGFNFSKIHHVIKDFPEDVAIIVVNGALRHWELMSSNIEPQKKRAINGYVVNNPYQECLSYLPKSDEKYYPTCLASSKTNHEFLKKYQGDVYLYEPTPVNDFGKKKKATYYIDDYRNPVCAAIGLAYQFGVRSLMLMCCDYSFEKKRDYAVQLDNKLWSYPQHLRCQEIIDANFYWLTHQEDTEIKIADFSSGSKYINAIYIKDDEEARSFFEDEPKEK